MYNSLKKKTKLDYLLKKKNQFIFDIFLFKDKIL